MSMYLLLQCDWQVVIKELPCLYRLTIILGAVLIAFFLWLKFCRNPKIKNSHVKEMKEIAFEEEKYWRVAVNQGSTPEQIYSDLQRQISEQSIEIEKLRYKLEQQEEKYDDMRNFFIQQSNN